MASLQLLENLTQRVHIHNVFIVIVLLRFLPDLIHCPFYVAVLVLSDGFIELNLAFKKTLEDIRKDVDEDFVMRAILFFCEDELNKI